jgi:hypothetical protein
MMDVWSEKFCEDKRFCFLLHSSFINIHQGLNRFSQQAINCELPIYHSSDLKLAIHITNAKTARNPNFLEEVEDDIKWGEPRRCYNYEEHMIWSFSPEVFKPEQTAEFWDRAPIIRF